MAVTRIKNNQITDSTITGTKIANNTLTGGLFATDLTLNSNLSVVGNLSVTGNTTTINSTNTLVNDPILVFNNGYVGSLTNYSIGMLVNRNLASLSEYGAVNTAWVWSENDGAFIAIATTDVGNGITSINNSGWANVKIGNLSVTGAITSTNFNLSTANIIDAKITTLVATNFSSGNVVISGGYIASLTNATITTGNVSSWYAATLNATNGNITTLDAGTTTSATLNTSTANITNGSAGTLVTTNFSTGNARITGGYADDYPIGANTAAPGTFTFANATTIFADTTTSTTLNATTGNITTLGAGTTTSTNLNATNGNITTLVATNFSTANARIAGGYADNFPIGANTAAPGTFTTANATTVNAETTTSTTLNATTGNITTLGVGTTTTAVLNSTTGNVTTLVATNFSSGNVVISGGYISALSNATITTGNAGSWTAATLNSTTGNITTLTSTTINAGTTTSAILNATTGNITTLGAGTTTSATLNATTGNISFLGAGSTTSAILNSTTGNITTLDAGTTTSATLNATNGNITTLGAGTTTTATLNTTNGNITNGNSTTFVATNFSTANARITGGYADNFPVGANTRATGAFTTLTSNGLTTFTDATQSDNSSTGAVVVTGGVGIGGNLNVAGNTTITGNLTVLGNTTVLNTETLNVEDLNITIAANATSGAEANGAGLTVAGANATFTYLNADDSWNLNKKLNGTTVGAATVNATFANISSGYADNFPVGANTAAPGRFTTVISTGVITSSGNLVANSGVNATNYTTGAIVVPDGGGVGITGDLWVQGISNFQGNIIAGNIQLSGNINVPVGGTFSNTGVFYGNAGGIGALYAGITNYTPIDHVVLQLAGNIDNYVQVNFQNVNSGNQASTDLVATADNGTDIDGYINLGINSSTFDDVNYPDFFPNDGYLIHHGVAGVGGNLIVMSELPDSSIKFRVGGYGTTYVRAVITNTGLRVNTTTQSTSLTSGALIVDGGLGVAGNIHAAAINNTPIGNTTPNTGAFTTLTATDIAFTTLVATNFSSGNARITGGYADNFPIGANTAAPGTFTFANATTIFAGTTTSTTLNSTTGNITTLTSTTINAGTTTSATLNATTGNITTLGAGTTTSATLNATNGNITTLDAGTTTSAILNSTSGNITTLGVDTTTTTTLNSTTGNITTLGAGTTTSAVLNATTGNITTLGAGTTTSTTLNATNGNVTTLVATNFSTGNAQISGGYADNFPIGANTAAPGRFTTVTATGVITSSGNLVANSGTASTSTTTGALVVTGTGGAGIGGNLNVGQSAIFNTTKTANYDFIVRGDNDDTLIWARPSATYDQVVIGNNATTGTLVTGAKVIVNTTDSMIIPTGTTTQRPGSSGGVDTAGMIRFNTSLQNFEFFDGTNWAGAGSAITVIASDQFTGDGLTTIFTLGASSTTASAIISINGVVQLPVTAYNIVGTTLTFTEAPQTGDTIDVRRLATTSVVSNLQTANGYVSVSTDVNAGIVFVSNASAATEAFVIDLSGALVTRQANTSIATANTATTIDSFALASYRSAKYLIQATGAGKVQTSELLVVHDNTTAYETEYAIVQPNGNVGVAQATISGSNVLVQFIPIANNTNVRIFKEYIPV